MFDSRTRNFFQFFSNSLTLVICFVLTVMSGGGLSRNEEIWNFIHLYLYVGNYYVLFISYLSLLS
ncbi:hypothetical protein F4804DRAFT_306596 [Jackrogersella minutella]|nr:hypothetical protein F4804DRAFT_306596 [Jackrogersella minutella]